MNTYNINICWHGAFCPEEYLPILFEDIERLAEDLESPSDLISHTCMLTKDWNGPSIHVWGEKGSSYFHCEYFENTEWVKFEENAND